MATVMTSSRPSSGTNYHLLTVPFPTSPSLPDRRARLKRLNLTMTRRQKVTLSERLSTHQMDTQDKDREWQMKTVALLPVAEYGFSPKDTALKSHRNIVRSRHHKHPGHVLTLSSRPASPSRKRRNRSRMSRRQEEKLPEVIVTTTASSREPQGIFLTSLVYEEFPDRRNSISCRVSGGEIMTHPISNDSSKSRDSHDSYLEREHLPDISTSSRAVAPRNPLALQHVYLEGLDYMRNHVTSVEEEAERINLEFHKGEEKSAGDDLSYLQGCNDRLLQANSELRRRDVKLQVIDSDAGLVKLLNTLRAGKRPDQQLVDFLTSFWNKLKSATGSLQALLDHFSSTVLQRLSTNYMSSHSADPQAPVCRQYTLDIRNFMENLETQLANANLLLKSYGNGLHKDLLDRSSFSENLMLTCDLKAFPLLSLVHDLCMKVTRMCDTARHWLARDEEFMMEVNQFIRQTRTVTKRREEILHTEKRKQKKFEKSVKVTQTILNNNREKLRLLEIELKHLQDKLSRSKEEQKLCLDEIQQKESDVDFLKVTLQQTKKNTNLHMKRTKLLRQVKELEDYLKLMDSELEGVQDQILAKSHQKFLLAEKINTSEKSYDALKTDLQRFSDNLEQLETEVTGLSAQLLQLEIIHTIRTSPETLDNLTDRPSTVKLSQSLKERIREKARKTAITSQPGSAYLNSLWSLETFTEEQILACQVPGPPPGKTTSAD